MKINRDFEEFLNEQKEWFCNYKCKMLKTAVVEEDELEITCGECATVNAVGSSDIKDCVCSNCPLDDFIWYIKDSEQIEVIT